jgi:tetratricopeptide (TPR) repeat protein
MKLSNDPKAVKVAVCLACAGVLLFGASINDPFHFDDALILKDSNVTNSARWSHFLNPLHLRQLTFFSFYLNYLFGGDSPAGFHLVNIGLHIANAVLLFVLLGRFLETWIAAAAAAIFLAHPIQTEPVLYIYQRSVLIACLFSLLALIALAERRHGWAAVFFFCAFEGKESAVGVPLAVALLWNHPYRIPMAAAATGLGAAALGLLAYWDESTVGIGTMETITPFSYFMTQTRVVYTYMRLLFVPYPQSLEYEFHTFWPALQIPGLAAILIGAWWLSRSDTWRVPGLAVLAFFLLLAPTSSLIPSADAAFEHRLYLPMLAFATAAAWAISRLPRRTIVAGVLLPVCAMLTVQRGTVWSSNIALWEDTLRHAPGKARVWFNHGGAHLESAPDIARASFMKALELRPGFTEALYNIGVIEQRKGNLPLAIAYYERATTQSSSYWPAWNNMGNAFVALGQHERALQCYERTLSLNPDYWPAQYNVAVVHYQNGRFDAAIPRLKTVLDWRPEYVEARKLLASALAVSGFQAEAEKEWKKLADSGVALSIESPATISEPSSP